MVAYCSFGERTKRGFLTFFGAKKVAKKHPPHPRPSPIWEGCNRSSCRSYISVSWDHQRSRLFLSTTLDAGRLTLVDCVSVGWDHPLGFAAYMSRASLKKGPAWVLSTTLDAGRFGCGSSITLIILPLLKHRGYKGRGAPFFDNVPTAFYRGGWGVMMEKQGRRSWRIDEDEGLDSPASRGS